MDENKNFPIDDNNADENSLGEESNMENTPSNGDDFSLSGNSEAKSFGEDAPNEDDSVINYASEGETQIVEAPTDGSGGGNKKLPIIIICAVAAVLAICAIVYFAFMRGDDKKPTAGDGSTEVVGEIDEFDFYEGLTDSDGNRISQEEYATAIQQQLQEATTKLAPVVSGTSPNVIDATTAPITEGATAANKEELSKLESQIQAFYDRSLYMSGVMITDAESAPITISFDGDNFEILTNLDGIEVSILNLDGTLYIKRPALNQYVELTDAVMSVVGISADDFSVDFGTGGKKDSTTVVTYDVTINGSQGVCSEHRKEDGTSIRFYSVNGSIVQIDMFGASGNIENQLVLDSFSTAIPGDQLTLKGYTKSSIGAMLADAF